MYQHSLKKEIRASLAVNSDAHLGTYLHFRLVNDAIKDPSFEWEETKKEFRYRGEMYDVIAIHYEKNIATIYCINDHKEKALEKQVEKILQKQTNQSAGSKAVFQKMQLTAFDLPQSLLQPLNYIILKSAPPARVKKPVGIVADVLSPPPETNKV